MKKYRLLRTGLFLYECLRLQFVLLSFAILRPQGEMAFPWLACAACGALFPLMAFFMWLDFSRHGGFMPLYAAGKCISFVSVLAWVIACRQDIIGEIFHGGGSLFNPPLFFVFLLAGELLAVGAGVFVMLNAPARGRAEPANGGE